MTYSGYPWTLHDAFVVVDYDYLDHHVCTEMNLV